MTTTSGVFDTFRDAFSEAFRATFEALGASGARLWDHHAVFEMSKGETPGSLQGHRVYRRLVTSSTAINAATTLRHQAPSTFLPALVENDRARQVINWRC